MFVPPSKKWWPPPPPSCFCMSAQNDRASGKKKSKYYVSHSFSIIPWTDSACIQLATPWERLQNGLLTTACNVHATTCSCLRFNQYLVHYTPDSVAGAMSGAQLWTKWRAENSSSCLIWTKTVSSTAPSGLQRAAMSQNSTLLSSITTQMVSLCT